MKRINFTTAKLAKEAKFNEPCFYIVNHTTQQEELSFEETGEILFTVEDIEAAKENGYECYLLPFQSQLQEWLRNVHGIHIIVGYRYIPNYSASPRYGKPTFECEIQVLKQAFKEGVFEGEDDIIRVQDKSGLSFDTYEEALEEGLIQGLKIVIDAESNM